MADKNLPLNAPANAKVPPEAISWLQQLINAGSTQYPQGTKAPLDMPADKPGYPNFHPAQRFYNQALPRVEQLTQYPRRPGMTDSEYRLLLNMLGAPPQEVATGEAPPLMKAHPQSGGLYPDKMPIPMLPSHGPFVPVEPQPGLRMSDLAIKLLGGGGEVPQPNISVPAGSFKASEYQKFQSPDTVGQITGGNPAGYLSLPQKANLMIPLLAGTTGFGLSPEVISSALNTNLQYQMALDAQNQRDFANRVTQVTQAGNIDDRAQRQFSQAFIDEANALGLDISRFNAKYAETPQQKRARDSKVRMEEEKYRSQLAESLSLKAKAFEGNANWDDRTKQDVKNATKILMDWIASDEAPNLTEGSGLEALMAGTAKIRTPGLRIAVKHALDVYKRVGLNPLGVNRDTSEVIDIREKIRQNMEALKNAK